MVRSSMKTWSPQTRSSSWVRLCTRSGWLSRKWSSLNSVAPIFTSRPCPVTRCVAGSSRSGPTSTGLSSASGDLPAQHRADPRHQLGRRERLGQVVVGAGIEPGDLVGVERAGRQHDHRQGAGSGLAAPAPGQLQPGLPGSIQSRITRSGTTRSTSACACSASAATRDLEAGVAQVDRDQLGDRRLVLDDQDPAHVLLPAQRTIVSTVPTLLWRTSVPLTM